MQKFMNFTISFLGLTHATTLINTDAQFAAVWWHNWYRYLLATGQQRNKNGTLLPTAKNMYAMVCNV